MVNIIKIPMDERPDRCHRCGWLFVFGGTVHDGIDERVMYYGIEHREVLHCAVCHQTPGPGSGRHDSTETLATIICTNLILKAIRNQSQP